MTMQPQTIQRLALRVISLEAARGESPAGVAGRVCDRLRTSLVRLAGVAGFRALMSRALALAKREAEARPMPPDPPVTMATRGSMGFSDICDSVLVDAARGKVPAIPIIWTIRSYTVSTG